MLVGLVNYLLIKVDKYKNFNFDELIFEYEYWRYNRVKNKIGFGIFKYFKMKDIWNSDKIKIICFYELGKDFISKKIES